MGHIKIHIVIRSRRRTIALVVGSDATLTVRAPIQAPMEYIEDLVRKKLPWIKERIAEMQSRARAHRKRFVGGESFPYLGDLYKLSIVRNAKARLFSRRNSFSPADINGRLGNCSLIGTSRRRGRRYLMG